jgi:carbonic anhydrase
MQRVVCAIALSLFVVFPAAADEWDDLMRGNRRYVDGHLVYSHLTSQRRATRAAQEPPVTVISCSDSRVPPELMFDQTVGDLFVVRVAGNVIEPFNLASAEYAAAPGNGWTKLIVVVGHEECGAVKEALSNKTEFGSPALNALVAKIRANLDGKKPPLREATDINARASARQLAASKIIRDSKVPIVTAYYSFDGKVTKVGD